MQGGALRSFCFFALLLSTGVTCSGQISPDTEDLTHGSLQELLDESGLAEELGLRKNSGLQSLEENDLEASNRNAAALATASSRANSRLSGLYNPNLVPPPALSNLPYSGSLGPKYQSDAEALALAQAGAGLLSPDLGSSLADANALAYALGGAGRGHASAEALAKALAHVQSQPRLNLGYPSGVLNSAAANALAQAHGGGNALSGAQSQAQTLGGLSQSQAQSQAQTLGGGSAQAQSQAQSGAGLGLNPLQSDGLLPVGNFQGSAFAHALADARTRVIPAHEYVLPHSIPGGQQVLQCSREGEFHNFWSSSYDCLVCACINHGGFLAPVCASCAKCMVPPVPEPPPVPVATCDPLPTETPFENPLNPCQICACHLTVDGYGQQDAQIVCQDNPECLVPNIFVLPIPSRTSKPVPIPMPLCEQLPTNVWFPHPNDACSRCECLKAAPWQLAQAHIICYPIPHCVVPENPPVPLRPLPPGPLPGPSPHKSCRPFAPNQPFSHPWDECQECVCSESGDFGLINVEVNCYTKKECCLEAPRLPQRAPAPVSYENVVYIEPRCRQRPPQQLFLVDCDVCTCETVYNYVVAKCTRMPHCDVGPLHNGGLLPYWPNPSLYTNSPGRGDSHVIADASAFSNVGLLPYLNSGGYGSAAADAESSANSGHGYASASANTEVFGGSGSGLGLLPGSLVGLSEADAIANVNSGLQHGDLSTASAAANALSNVGLNAWNSQLLPNLSPVYQSSATAEANSNVNSGYNLLSPGSASGNSATAEALASALSNVNGLSPHRVQMQPNNPSFLPLAELEELANSASANANALSFVNPLLHQQYYYLQPGNDLNSGLYPSLNQVNPYSRPSYQPSLSSGSAGANAVANSNVELNSYLPGYQTGSLSSAQAKALAQANSGLLLPGLQGSNYASANTLADVSGSYPYAGYSPYTSAEADAFAASNVYSGLSPQVNPWYQQGLGSLSNAQAQALASSQGQGQGQASAQSQASALSGWPLIKSAPAEDGDNDYDAV